MVQAYILIQTEVGKAAQVAKEVRDIAGVAEAEDVTGPYDVIVRAEAKNVDELGKLVVAKIQGVEGITRHSHLPRVVHPVGRGELRHRRRQTPVPSFRSASWRSIASSISRSTSSG